MDVFEPGLYLVVQSQESLQVETAFCVDPQGVDLHSSRGPVVGGCDHQTVTHCVQHMANRADVLSAPQKSNPLIARQLVMLLSGLMHTTALVALVGPIFG